MVNFSSSRSFWNLTIPPQTFCLNWPPLNSCMVCMWCYLWYRHKYCDELRNGFNASCSCFMSCRVMPSLKKGRRHNVSDLCNVLCLLFLMHSQWSSIQSILFCLESIFWVFTCILYLLLCRSLCPSSESPSDLGVYYNTLCGLFITIHCAA